MRESSCDSVSQVSGSEQELAHPDAGNSDKPALAQDSSGPSTSRRQLLLRGAAALGAAAVAGTASTAEGADGGPVVIGAGNVGTTTTYLTTTNNCFWAYSTNGNYGVIGQSDLVGTYGSTDSTLVTGAGVAGISGSASGQAAGVLGRAFSPNAPGVYGTNAGGGNGVRAEIPASASGNAIGLYALNYSTYTGGAPGAGGFAIYGLSARGHGLVGATAAPGAAAVVGATNGVAGAYAAAFYGPVIVSGNFTVVGGAKSAAVPHPDGSHRRLYCVESPESWFEDFGEGTLVCGSASIALDPDFAAVVDTARYFVFLTGNDGQSDLSVFNRTPDGFKVRASGAAEGTFSWRVVAKRKDIAGARFERVEVSKEPALPPVPASARAEVPAPLEPPQLTRRVPR